VLASEGRQRYIYTKTHKNIKEKKIFEIFIYMYEAPHHDISLYVGAPHYDIPFVFLDT
jgi:hypothetical protein